VDFFLVLSVMPIATPGARGEGISSASASMTV
jgi:hypothetical protein